jgi:hypothetical protein
MFYRVVGCCLVLVAACQSACDLSHATVLPAEVRSEAHETGEGIVELT